MFTVTNWQEVLNWTVSVLALIGLVCDLGWGRIFNAFTVPTAIAGVVAGAWLGSWPGFGNAIAGLVLGLSLFLPLFYFGIMGGGDLKFLAALGAWVGPKVVAEIAVLSLFLGGVMAFILLVVSGRFLDFWKRVSFSLLSLISAELEFQSPKLDKKFTMPYGIPMALAAIWVMWAHPLQRWGFAPWF